MTDITQVGPQSYWELHRDEVFEIRIQEASASADRATHEPSLFHVSALRVSIASPQEGGND